MSLFDPLTARLLYEERLRNAQENRRAHAAAKANGAQTLLSRMVKLLSRSSRPSLKAQEPDEALPQRQLADAKSS